MPVYNTTVSVMIDGKRKRFNIEGVYARKKELAGRTALSVVLSQNKGVSQKQLDAKVAVWRKRDV